VLGAITFVAAESGRRYTPDDLGFAQHLARRSAIAIENARLYREAQEAVRARDQFLSIASHELKTPLTSLMGYAELLQRRIGQVDALAERDRRAVRVIAEQTARLNRLIATLLDLSRLQSGQLSIEHAPVDLNALARRIVDETQLVLERHTLELSAPEDGKPLVVTGDELRLEQVLQNLIQNAIKYSPMGGLIRVELEPRDGMARLSVSDQGLGIPPSEQRRIFEKFYRLDPDMTRGIGGTGLGLYICRELVRRVDGRIWVESQPGHGSTFFVEIPVSHRRPRTARAPEAVSA
jgi:signal transduction histidine kinase